MDDGVPPDQGPIDVLSTLDLLVLVNRGESAALNALCARYVPRLRRWASGRLPADSRSLLDTEDLVQESVIATVQRLSGVNVSGPGALQAYFRQAILNRIRDQIRWSRRRHNVESDAVPLPDRNPTPLEAAIGRDVLDAYDGALVRLSEEDQILIHLRLELDYGYAEIAEATGKPTANAARMATSRAIGRLGREMKAYDPEPEAEESR